MNCPVNSALEFLNHFMIPYHKDADTLEWFAQHNKWKVPYDIAKMARKSGNTIILTDIKQQIVWVSSFFENLTEYEINEAVGQSPRFLQGPKTCKDTNAKVRESIKNQVNFDGKLINYKKSGLLYECKVSIQPLFNETNQLSHFIAFEHEVR